MSMKSWIEKLLSKEDLTEAEMHAAMSSIMTGGATPVQIAGFLVALRAKGETVDEVVSAAGVIRGMASRVCMNVPHLVDTCGTGGDGANTFNISTAAAFVVAAAGGKVAKHGNRSVSSKSGSADLLEAAGVNIQLSPDAVSACVETVGLGFLFAQRHHEAMQFARQARSELGIRTIFNLLGPLTNPAGAENQVVGVFSSQWLEPLAKALQKLGSRHVLIVHAEDGLDEVSIAAPTQVAELVDGEVKTYRVVPEDFGLETASMESLAVQSAPESLGVINSIFSGQKGPARDIVVLNAAAAIYVSGIANDWAEGIQIAERAIDTGAASKKMRDLISYTQSFGA